MTCSDVKGRKVYKRWMCALGHAAPGTGKRNAVNVVWVSQQSLNKTNRDCQACLRCKIDQERVDQRNRQRGTHHKQCFTLNKLLTQKMPMIAQAAKRVLPRPKYNLCKNLWFPNVSPFNIGSAVCQVREALKISQ